MNRGRKYWLTAIVLAAALMAAGPAVAAKNVFMMITDGASFGTWDMTDLYTHGSVASSTYYGADFKKYLMTTFPLNTAKTPTGGNNPEVSYEPDKAWDITPNSGSFTDPHTGKIYPNYFNAYDYLRQNYTDSAAAVTALATGQKTYNSAINWSNDPAVTGAPITPTVPELAKQYGKAVGTISSVQWSHATPAGFSNAHNISRNNYISIANDMLNGTVMDVIMGTGDPQWNNDGVKTIATYNDPAITDSKAKYVGGRDTWIALNEGTHPQGWNLIQSKADFEAIASGVLPANLRVLGVPEVGSTLQQSRSGYAPTDKVGDDPLNAGVPTLVTMTKAAVNLLQAKSQATGDKGFFLHIEGGAIDWAAHGNQVSRIIEEQMDFNNTVDWVVGWIEANGGWANNLLVITTDHANSMPLGPNSDTIPFDPIELGDVSGTPNILWHSNNHMNQLVPLFVRGAGADMFAGLVDGIDTYFDDYYPNWIKAGFDGRYVDNTDVGVVLKKAVVPLPATVYLLAFGLGGLGLLRRRPSA